MKILHLSDTTLSGSPIRITDLLNKYTEHKARHIVWSNHIQNQPWRKFKVDLEGRVMDVDSVQAMFDWADVIHYHNRYSRQEIFKKFGLIPPNKPSVIQIHSPRASEDFKPEVLSGLPLAIIAQYHVRQWPEARYILPNVVDINAPENRRDQLPRTGRPVVSFAPSNWNAKGWDNKGYSVVAPILKKMALNRKIFSQIITSQSHEKTMELKRGADIAIDEIITGSYHLSSLEYLSLGVPCFANIDEQTAKVVRLLTGCTDLPWIQANKDDFERKLVHLVESESWRELGDFSRQWMEQYWAPGILAKNYVEMYEDLTNG